jgi:hypothetical protein
MNTHEKEFPEKIINALKPLDPLTNILTTIQGKIKRLIKIAKKSSYRGAIRTGAEYINKIKIIMTAYGKILENVTTEIVSLNPELKKSQRKNIKKQISTIYKKWKLVLKEILEADKIILYLQIENDLR